MPLFDIIPFSGSILGLELEGPGMSWKSQKGFPGLEKCLNLEICQESPGKVLELLKAEVMEKSLNFRICLLVYFFHFTSEK